MKTPASRSVVLLVALVALCLTAFGATATAATAPTGTPTATHFTGRATVGPIFHGSLAAGHQCTASVIASPTHDLVLTAAHCVVGTGVGWTVAPGYHNGVTPYGLWTVAAAYVQPAWETGVSRRYDYAVLRLAKQRQANGTWIGIQDRTGANTVATAPAAGTTITDVAYNWGVNDTPITCSTPVFYEYGYPSFNCHGYVGGSSGSPWLQGRTVVGVIGGMHGGGCLEWKSHSSSFRTDVNQLIARASAGGAGDTVPPPGSDGC